VSREVFVEAFAEGYMHGLTMPGGMISSTAPGFNEGVQAGQQIAPIPLPEYERYMLAFSCTKRTVSGTYTPRFESSDFQPDGVPERWWLTRSGYSNPERPVTGRVVVSGFLTPPGNYGHFGGWPREFIAVTIEPEK
jgi:hypothetical protein